MKRNILITASIFIFIGVIFYLQSNISRFTGKAKIVLRKKGEQLSTLKAWGPYGYYKISWQIVSNNQRLTIGSKGLTQFGFLGGSTFRNNYFHNNQLNIQEVNQKLAKMEINEPYLIWENNFGMTKEFPARLFIMITDNPDLYNQEEKLIILGSSLIKKK